MWKTLENAGIGNLHLNGSPIVQEVRERIDTWDYIEL
jgi:hypothetical protein